MKTTYKATIAVIAVVLFALFFKNAYSLYIGHDEKSTTVNLFQDFMIDAKEMFLEKSDPVQLASLGLMDQIDMSILRSEDGTPLIETDEGLVPLTGAVSAETEGYIKEIMGEYISGGVIYNIKVTSDAILFFTYYHMNGCVGFLYEKELNNTTYYDVIEITENWNVFYKMDNA